MSFALDTICRSQDWILVILTTSIHAKVPLPLTGGRPSDSTPAHEPDSSALAYVADRILQTDSQLEAYNGTLLCSAGPAQ